MDFQGNEQKSILVVDDEPIVRDILCRWLKKYGYECSQASNGFEALEFLNQNEHALLITDVMMPGMSGIELLKMVKKEMPDVAVIVLTAVDDREVAIGALEAGAFGYVVKPFDENEVVINVTNALERRRLLLSSKRYEIKLVEEVRERTLDVRRREEEIALRLVSASGFRDEETGEHIRRIGMYTAIMAEKLGWPAQQTDDLKIAGSMHDVGKIGISDSILRKPGKLTPEEFEIIKTHTEIGFQILDGSEIPLLLTARDIAFYHHEKWDGSGYPNGLREEEIPESARIVAISDVYDALVNDRVYRAALPEEEALRIIRMGKGTHFDPNIYECFMDILPEFRQVIQDMPDSSNEDGI